MCEQINTDAENRKNSGIHQADRYADHGDPEIAPSEIGKMWAGPIPQKQHILQNEARKRIDAALGLLKLKSLQK